MGLFTKARTHATTADEILAPVQGSVVALADVADPVFSRGTMGQGLGIVPDEGDVRAPVGGTVVIAFPTGHAYGIRTDDGVEVLIHVGLDTVQLQGRGFTMAVRQGQQVEVGELLATVDLDLIADEGKDPTTVVVVTNSSEYADVEPTGSASVTWGDQVLAIRR